VPARPLGLGGGFCILRQSATGAGRIPAGLPRRRVVPATESRFSRHVPFQNRRFSAIQRRAPGSDFGMVPPIFKAAFWAGKAFCFCGAGQR